MIALVDNSVLGDVTKAIEQAGGQIVPGTYLSHGVQTTLME